MAPQSTTVEQKLARIARGSHGVVTRAGLLRAGVTRDEIRERLRRGTLLSEHPGVYRVGHRAPGVEARYLAAVLACGEEAVLSGGAAAYVWGLVAGHAPPPEVTAPTKRTVSGVRTRRSRIDDRDVTIRRGIPVTAVPRTLVDLAAVLPEGDLAVACHRAGARYRTTPRQVEVVLERHPRAKGAGALRAVLRGKALVSLSRLESRFLGLLRAEGLPLPMTNRVADAHRVDCRWPDRHLTVELDSYRYHSSRHAWEQDRIRERDAYKRGDQHRRYTWRDVYEDSTAMLRELRALLARSPACRPRTASRP